MTLIDFTVCAHPATASLADPVPRKPGKVSTPASWASALMRTLRHPKPLDEAARDGLTRQQFPRHYLMRLGIGHDLTRIAQDPKQPRTLASEAELPALRTELNRLK